jgi:hypothetical protein
MSMGLRPAGPPHRGLWLVGDSLPELGQQPTLTDASSTHQHHQLRPPALAHPLVSVHQHSQLAFPTNQSNAKHRRW